MVVKVCGFPDFGQATAMMALNSTQAAHLFSEKNGYSKIHRPYTGPCTQTKQKSLLSSGWEQAAWVASPARVSLGFSFIFPLSFNNGAGDMCSTPVVLWRIRFF
jgi:hypothetical protein